MKTQTASTVRNKDGRVVGRIEDRVFVKEVHGSKHMLRQPAAWAIDCDIFDRIVRPLCFSVRVIDRETGAKYVIGTETFIKHRQILNRKFGNQYYVELVHWKLVS